MVAFSSATKNGMMECGKFHAMRLIYAEKASSCIIQSRWAGDDNEFPNDAEIDRP